MHGGRLCRHQSNPRHWRDKKHCKGAPALEERESRSMCRGVVTVHDRLKALEDVYVQL